MSAVKLSIPSPRKSCVLYYTFGRGCSLGSCLSVRFSMQKVYNAMQKVNDELHAKPEDATDFLVSLKSEPGMYCEYNLDGQGRLVDIFWSTAGQQENIARFGGCIQLDTTVFTNRCRTRERQGFRRNISINPSGHGVFDARSWRYI